MQKKYLVYISATDELKSERRELIKVINELGAAPVIMEGFDINDSDGHGYIKKAITESDYFINLTAHKCGTPAGKSYIPETEFSIAEMFRIPVISFIVGDKVRWKAAKKEKDEAAIKALENFKKRLRQHTNASWNNAADLRQKALEVMLREINLNPRHGWVRGDSTAAANEMARLIRENETFRLQTAIDGRNPVSGLKSQIRYSLRVLAANKISLSFWYTPGENWENTKVFRFLRLFKLLTPELSVAKTTSELSRFLGNILNPDLDRTVRKDYPTPTNTVKKIMADFGLLKLVRPVKERNGSSSDDEAWEITEYGREVFTYYRLRQMNKAIQKVHDQGE